MAYRLSQLSRLTGVLLFGFLLLSAGCSTRYLTRDQYLLKKNTIELKTDGKVTNRSEMKDMLNKTPIQKPNSNSLEILPFRVPLRLWRYNNRFRKLHNSPDSSLPKSVERPVILDTILMHRTAQVMRNNLFSMGYFYARVKDTFITSHQKAYVTYKVTLGKNYVINRINYFISDTDILKIVRASSKETTLQKGREFSYNLTDDERSRITAVLRNNGYYKFTKDNITFQLDTVDKAAIREIGSPLGNAVNFISSSKARDRSTLDIDVYIRLAEDTTAFMRYRVNSVNFYPDYKSGADLHDTTLLTKKIDSIDFRYHRFYVHPKVLYRHNFLSPGQYYSQENFDKTQAKLNELGIFQYARPTPRESRRNSGTIDYDVLISPAKKYDFSALYELSSGSTYALGHSVGTSFRDKNFMKGANLLSIGVNGGIELSYNDKAAGDITKRFDILTRYYGVNASIDFPKFLAPVKSSVFDNSNLPHTIIGVGDNVIDRVNYFTLVNTSANFSYNWHETQTKVWALSPAFINVIHLPLETDSFKRVLDSNAYLRNSYKENFIEGENISFIFDDIDKKHNINYSYLKLSFEEAGSLLSLINNVGVALNDLYKIQYAQYAKFDFDGRHYFNVWKSVIAVRFSGGIGMPYGQSTTLPYIKQYFSGGPYSLRGWRIRTLGPGSYYDPNARTNNIDRTGDIKLEFNGEFRFPVAPLFANAVKLNGALFADAGNIWLAKSDPAFPGGDFALSTLGQSIAADMGIGARFDIASFLTLRLDVAIPAKKPYVSTNGGWVFDQVNFNNSNWRANNVIFNISIGYPF